MASPVSPPSIVRRVRQQLAVLENELGSQAAVAQRIGVHESTISRAKTQGRIPPKLLAYFGFRRVTRFVKAEV